VNQSEDQFSRQLQSLSRAERKRLLIAQGAAFRNGVAQAGRVTQTSLRPDTLANGALGHLASTAMSWFGGAGKGKGAVTSATRVIGTALAGLDVAAVLPLVLSGASALSKRFLLRRAMVKPALYGALILGVAGATAVFLARRKKARAASQTPSAEMQP
jgi:hypothetical protein